MPMIEPRSCLAALALVGCGSNGPAPAASTHPASATAADTKAACALVTRVARYVISPAHHAGRVPGPRVPDAPAALAVGAGPESARGRG
jgi:hypothetical protein